MVIAMKETKGPNGTASLEGDLFCHTAAVLAQLHALFLSVCYMGENGLVYVNIISNYVLFYFSICICFVIQYFCTYSQIKVSLYSCCQTNEHGCVELLEHKMHS